MLGERAEAKAKGERRKSETQRTQSGQSPQTQRTQSGQRPQGRQRPQSSARKTQR